MKDEVKVIEKMIPQMEEIINAVPDERFCFKECEMLSIIERRMEACDLREALHSYNEIFAKNEKVDISDIKRSAVALVRIKALLLEESGNYDGRIYRSLIKDYRSQITKVSNIIRLTKVNGMTASEYEKEKIRQILFKNEELMSAFLSEIEDLENKIERYPVSKEEEIPKKIVQEEKEVKVLPKKKGITLGIKNIISGSRDKREVVEKLRMEEKNQSMTKCVEIPFYDKSLAFTEVQSCKDIPEYVILKRRNNIFFGLSKNVGKGSYDNTDQSLIELTEATEEMIQFMVEDLLDGKHRLRPFLESEKKSMQMYFNFVSTCFERNIGKTLSVLEYLNFKNYYNQLVLKMFSLEEQYCKQYYKALALADKYISYMESYDLAVSDDKESVISKILAKNGKSYVEDLGLILKHHMVDDKAKKMIMELIYALEGREINQKELKKVTSKEAVSGKLDPTPASIDPAIEFRATDYNDEEMISSEDMKQVQLKVQVLNQEKVIIDEALFSCANVKNAVADYLRRQGYIKKLGLYINGKEVFLYSSKNGSLSVPVLDEEMKKAKKIDQGIQGELTDFYEEKIRKIMVEFTQ